MLHWIAFPVVGFLVGVLVVQRGPGRRLPGLAAGVLGGIAGGLLLYHGGAANHHRLLSLVAAGLFALAASAGACRLAGGERARETRMRQR